MKRRWLLHVTFIDGEWEHIFFGTREEANEWKARHINDNDIASIEEPERI